MVSIHLPLHRLSTFILPRLYGFRRLQSSISDSAHYVQQRTRKRSGQDLTHRDVRLSKSIRQKQAFARVGLAETNALDPSSVRNGSIAQLGGGEASGLATPSKPPTKMFRGIVLPQKPRPPESDECCMSGCAICVYDIYLTSLESYRDDVSKMRSTLKAQNVPSKDWPQEIQEKTGGIKLSGKNSGSELDVSMSAFAALEKSLREASR